MEKKILSVSRLNDYIKGLLTDDSMLRNIHVKGEITGYNLKNGYIFFELKDETVDKCVLTCAVWSRYYKEVASLGLKRGDKIIATGSIDTYAGASRYQLIVTSVERDGEGDWYQALKQLSKKLEEMGMFAPEYKKPIPRYAMSLGVVTSANAAAVHDIIKKAKEKNPYIQIIVCPAVVQGKSAPASIAAGIKTLDRLGLDVMIVGRGGGSKEDLMAFNSEEVARAIFACNTPVISAVGHEIDAPIIDSVADAHAITPTDAADKAVFSVQDFYNSLSDFYARLDSQMALKLERVRQRLKQDEQVLSNLSPARQLEAKKDKMNQLSLRMYRAVNGKLDNAINTYYSYPVRLAKAMDTKLMQARNTYSSYPDRLSGAMDTKLIQVRNTMQLMAEKLEGVSPLKSLNQGFAYISTEDGKRLSKASDAQPGDMIRVSFTHDSLDAEVRSVSENDTLTEA